MVDVMTEAPAHQPEHEWLIISRKELDAIAYGETEEEQEIIERVSYRKEIRPHPPAPATIKMRMPEDLEEFWLREHDTAIARAATLATLDDLGTMLNSRIAQMEILDANNPSSLRKGVIMAYRDIEKWEMQKRKSLRAAGDEQQ
jgi:hypothetical protein